MPELPSQRTAARLRRMTSSALCALSLGALAVPVLAQTVPAGLRACVAVSDSARRLACYDRAMARLTTPRPPTHAASAPLAHAASPAPAAVSSAASPEAGSHDTSARHSSRLWNVFGGGDSQRVSAHVASLD